MTDDEVRLPYLTDETNRLPREIHAVGSDWFHGEQQYLREHCNFDIRLSQPHRQRRLTVWFLGLLPLAILIGSLCLCLIGWSAFVYGAAQLWNWVLP